MALLKTRADLATQALINLQRIGDGQAPSAGDQALALDHVGPMLARLEVMGIADQWSERFSDAEFLPLASCLADSLARPFLISGQELADIRADRLQAEADLRALRAGDAGGTVRFSVF